MAVTKAYAVSLIGLAGTIIEIEAEISSNLPSFVLVGLPDASLSEARDRVRAAAHNSGLALPGRRVTVNLSPASVPKRGASFDLAIAVAILAASAKLKADSVAGFIHLGELGLDGSVRAIPGILPAVLAARASGWTKFIVPFENLEEAGLVDEITVWGAKTLAQVSRFHGADLIADELIQFAAKSERLTQEPIYDLDLADVIGQDDAVDALTLAAAGGHHLLMVGPPGVGKTMLAERLPSILPQLTFDESLETSALRSIAGSGGSKSISDLAFKRPFEAPHHTASLTSLIGGGANVPRPGLVSLANHGVLFLDEAPEFQRPILEALRQPLESGEVLISRTAGLARFPAKFQLVMAANPCPCGKFSGNGRACVCPAASRLAYLSKLSGPLLDRIDVRLKLQATTPAQVALARLGATQVGRSSAEIRGRVVEARERSRRRLKGTPWTTNSEIPGSFLRKTLGLDPKAASMLDKALERGNLSMRGYDRCLRMAWSNADLAGRDRVLDEDVAKAAMLRGEDGAGSW
jgi:magnesium chelatase family protein